MTLMEELLAAIVGALESRQRDALKVLRGEAMLADPLDPAPMRPPLLLGMGAAAKYLGVSRPTLWRMIQAGRVKKVELFPGSHRVRRDDIEELASQRVSTGKTVKTLDKSGDQE